MNIETLLSKLSHVKKTASGWQACCPAHEDKKASLSISVDGNKILMYDHAGCETPVILEKIGLKPKDLFLSPPTGGKIQKKREVAAYSYCDEAGNTLYQVVRFSPKDFRQRRPDQTAKDGWVWKMAGVRLVPYHLPDLLKATGPVFIAEGEKDVEALRSLGLTATCNVGGAGKWKAEYSQFFKGRHVAIIPDNDEPGRKHAEDVAAKLRGHAETVTILELPGPGKDAFDWIQAGGTKTDLLALWAQEEKESPAPEPALEDPIAPAENPVPAPVVPAKVFPHRHHTDLGNGERLVDRFGPDLRYCHPWKSWLTWDSKKWTLDESGAVDRMAKATARSIYQEAQQEPDELRRRELAKHAARSEGEARISAMVNLATSEPGIPVAPKELDADPWSLCVENGVIDLHTGKLRPHDRKDLFTKICPAIFDPTATAPLWEKALLEIMGGNLALVGFLRRAVGYTLTGNTSEHAFFITFGAGRNGKTVVMETMAGLMGDYARESKTETLMLGRDESGSGANEDVAILAGARLVSANESKTGQRLDERKIKALTGGDRVRARRLYQGSFEFIPEFKLWLRTNHRPVVGDTDAGIWDRIFLIPFSVYFPPAKRDKKLIDKIRAEFSGVLNWALAGCLEWQKAGLNPPPEVLATTEEYRVSQDVLHGFLQDRCFLPQSAPWAVKTTAANLYSAYVEWCQASGERPKSQRVFGEALQERGFKKGRSGVGATVWEGIGLLQNSEGSEPSEPFSRKSTREKFLEKLPESGSDPSDPSDPGKVI